MPLLFAATDTIHALLSFRDNKTSLLLCTPQVCVWGCVGEGGSSKACMEHCFGARVCFAGPRRAELGGLP